MTSLRILVALTATAALAHATHAQHVGDIGLFVADGAIHTQEITSAGYGAPRLVFSGQMGDTGSPHFTSNPGFDVAPGTFDPSTRIGFQFTSSLLVWNGASFESTSPAGPLAGERMKGSFLTVNATSADGPVAGFDLSVQSNGGWHRHISWTLLPAPGQGAPEPGVYLLQLQMYSTDPSVGVSAPFAIVFNDGASESDFQEAFAAASEVFNGPPCRADLNGDSTVDGGDLGALLGLWGMPGAADLNGDGTVDGGDLGQLLGSWGACS